MSKFLSVLIVLSIAVVGLGQKTPRPSKPASPGKSVPKPTPFTKTSKTIAAKPVAKKPVVKPATAVPFATPTPDPEVDRQRFDAAVAARSNSEKARLLRLFVDEFPVSELRTEALDYLVTSRAVNGDEKIKAGEIEVGVASFKLAVEEAPLPTPDRMFDDVIAKIPANLFYSGHRGPAMELAAAIEKKYAGNTKRLLSMAGFYLSIENGAEAQRVAESAIAIEPNSVAAFQALGLAHRLNFDLEESAKAYAKAIELDPASIPAKRSLAEMKRATGHPEEAAAIYREIIAANANDIMARNGLVLSLFDSGKRTEAETLLTELLDRTPKNFTLLAGVGYWYAANGVADKAIEYAQKAVEAEPRYIWGHIALARGLMKANRPVDAERILIKAKQYGNFPTLEYEIASARFKAGLYREAVEELQKNFTLRDGLIETHLGGRLQKAETTFQELLAHERRASILEPMAADDAEVSSRMRVLLELTGKLSPSADEPEIIALTDRFVSGDDKMKLHRQLHAADILLQKNVAVSKAAELIRAAVGNTDSGLEVAAPGAAVMASELYESRTVAFARNEIILIPEVPRQTLSAILRGRIEELAGWTFYQQKNYPAAVVRLKRAISVMPDKSAWWRSSMWRLGAALEADGKDKEALDSYIQSYKIDRPSALRYGVIESLYRRVNGSTDGLEDKIGPNPLPTIASVPAVNESEQTDRKTVPSDRVTPAETVSPDRSKASVVEKTASVKTPSTAIKTRPSGNVAKPVAQTPKQPEVRADEQTGKRPDQNDTAKTSVVEPPKVSEVEEKKDSSIETAGDRNIETPKQTSQNLEPEREKVIAVVEPEPKQTERPEPNNVKPDPLPNKKTNRNVKERKILIDTGLETKKLGEGKIEDTKVNRSGAANTSATETKSSDQPETIQADTKTIAEPPPLTRRVDKTSEEKPPTTGQNANTGSETGDKTLGGEKPQSDQPTNLLRDPLPESASDSKPVETKSAETKSAELRPADSKPAETKPVESKPAATEKKPVIIIEDPVKRDDTPRTRDLFEPVIISVPRNASQKPPDPKTATDTKTKKPEDSTTSGAVRARVIEGKEISSDQKCSIEVDQENISLLNGGGSLGVLVSIAGQGTTRDVTAVSNSPRDVEVRAEPEIAGLSGRRFYVVKSVSTKTGIFQVNFESRCGKKEIAVRVR